MSFAPRWKHDLYGSEYYWIIDSCFWFTVKSIYLGLIFIKSKNFKNGALNGQKTPWLCLCLPEDMTQLDDLLGDGEGGLLVKPLEAAVAQDAPLHLQMVFFNAF